MYGESNVLYSTSWSCLQVWLVLKHERKTVILETLRKEIFPSMVYLLSHFKGKKFQLAVGCKLARHLEIIFCQKRGLWVSECEYYYPLLSRLLLPICLPDMNRIRKLCWSSLLSMTLRYSSFHCATVFSTLIGQRMSRLGSHWSRGP